MLARNFKVILCASPRELEGNYSVRSKSCQGHLLSIVIYSRKSPNSSYGSALAGDRFDSESSARLFGPFSHPRQSV